MAKRKVRFPDVIHVVKKKESGDVTVNIDNTGQGGGGDGGTVGG